jgi:hypothetical protein
MQRLACMNVFKSKWIYLLFIVLISNSVRAQNAIDSLKIKIKKSDSDSSKSTLLAYLALDYTMLTARLYLLIRA